MSTSTEADSETGIPDSVTYREVQEIIRTFRGSEWKSMTLEIRGLRISIGKDGPPASVAAAAAPAATAPASTAPAKAAAPSTRAAAPSAPPTAPSASSVDTEGCVAVRSPAVGSFWVAPSPGEAPFVQVGDTVTEDQQLAIVEVMKLMNPVVTSVAGEVVEVCAANAELVEYEQVLFWIRPDHG
ncbi:MAG TPA: acetyl-CoA carboxylase biotin carboxyl carrier protein [Pseudonocardia sp.]|jgi:acetyl-CoA carboxylase biotin carboxyl carrier protein|nr:acetyl-CoA carboxylase biotin carboxyl carrier protein [Pseudonocardia sp.]